MLKGGDGGGDEGGDGGGKSPGGEELWENGLLQEPDPNAAPCASAVPVIRTLKSAARGARAGGGATKSGVGDGGGEGGGDGGGGGGDGGAGQRTSPSLSTVGGEEGSGGGVPALLDSREFGPTIASWAGEHLQVGLRNHGMSGDWRGHVNDRHRTATQRPDVRAGSMPLLTHSDSSVPSDPHHGQLVALSTCDGGDPGWAKGLRQDPDPSAAPWEGAVDVMQILESEGALSLGRGG